MRLRNAGARQEHDDLIGKRRIRKRPPHRRTAFDQQPRDTARDQRFHQRRQPQPAADLIGIDHLHSEELHPGKPGERFLLAPGNPNRRLLGRFEKFAFGRQWRFSGDDHTDRRARLQTRETARQLGVVIPNCPRADENGVRRRTQQLPMRPRHFTGNPARRTTRAVLVIANGRRSVTRTICPRVR